MKLFLKYIDRDSRRHASNMLEVDLGPNETVLDIKRRLIRLYEIVTDNEKRLVVEYAKCDMPDHWILTDIPIPLGSTLKCYVATSQPVLFHCLIKFVHEWKQFFAWELIDNQSTRQPADFASLFVLDVRVFLSKRLGLPLTLFRLREARTGLVMFDENKVGVYAAAGVGGGWGDVGVGMKVVLETWHEWDGLLKSVMRGYTKHVLEYLSPDEAIRAYQMNVALYMAAVYGNVGLTKKLMRMGARVDKPVGEHPCRQWCPSLPQQQDNRNILKQTTTTSRLSSSSLRFNIANNQQQQQRLFHLKHEFLKCPIHAAIQSGQLKIITMICKEQLHTLAQPDGYGRPPWRLALHNDHKDPVKNENQKECARYLLTKHFSTRISVGHKGPTISLNIFHRLMCWLESAQAKVSHNLPRRERTFHRLKQNGLLGNKVLIDGFNNNFRDDVNSFERLRYRNYYFLDNEERERFNQLGSYLRLNSHNNRNKKHPVAVKSASGKVWCQVWRKAVRKVLFKLMVRKYTRMLERESQKRQMGGMMAQRAKTGGLLRKREVFLRETTRLIDEYNRLSLPEAKCSADNARLILDNVSEFRLKSGLAKVQIGEQIGKSTVRRSLKRMLAAKTAAGSLNKSLPF